MQLKAELQKSKQKSKVTQSDLPSTYAGSKTHFPTVLGLHDFYVLFLQRADITFGIEQTARLLARLDPKKEGSINYKYVTFELISSFSHSAVMLICKC